MKEIPEISEEKSKKILAEEKIDDHMDHSKYPKGIPYYDLYPEDNKPKSSKVLQVPIDSRAFESSFSTPGHSLNGSIFLSSVEDNGNNLGSESRQLASDLSKDSKYQDLGQAITEAKYLHILKIMRLARYSILTACFSDILTILFPLFIFSIVFALKGLKTLNFFYLFMYLIYYAASTIPYIVLAYFVRRIEIYIICSVFCLLKFPSFVMVSLFLVKILNVKGDVRSRLIIDFSSNPGKNCVCCL